MPARCTAGCLRRTVRDLRCWLRVTCMYGIRELHMFQNAWLIRYFTFYSIGSQGTGRQGRGVSHVLFRSPVLTLWLGEASWRAHAKQEHQCGRPAFRLPVGFVQLGIGSRALYSPGKYPTTNLATCPEPLGTGSSFSSPLSLHPAQL